ncbi:BppA, partial (plasmid) [Borrelia miyamotoi]
REIPFEDNLSMRKGKVLEDLGFDEFVRIYSDNIQVLHKNKYANGIDKYNYFKKINGEDTLVGSTIDGWFVNSDGEAELLEIKCSDNLSLRSAILEYNKTGNFLDNRYFFKYYIQVQLQLACTGLDKGNLFFIIGNEAINCVIIRNNDLISKVMSFVKELAREVNHICTRLRSQTDIDIKTTSLEELGVHIKSILEDSYIYKNISELDYRVEFMEFVESIELEIG